jgi:cell division protein FtsZ
VIWRNQATGTNDAIPTMRDLSTFAPTSPIASVAMANTAAAAPSMMAAQPAPVMPATTGVDLNVPSVFRQSPERMTPTLGADSSPQARNLLEKGTDYFEIPAFLRKQAD